MYNIRGIFKKANSSSQRNSIQPLKQCFLDGSDSKESACNSGDPGSIPGLGKFHGEGSGNSLQYSCLENSMDRGAWRATVHGVIKNWTQLSNFHFTSLLKAYVSVHWSGGGKISGIRIWQIWVPIPTQPLIGLMKLFMFIETEFQERKIILPGFP